MGKYAKQIILLISLTILLGWFCKNALVTVHRKLDFYRTEEILAEIETALSRYQIDHANYPIHTGEPELGGTILYNHLTTQFETYLARGKNGEHAEEIDGKPTLVDYWGNPIRYRAFPPDTPESERDTRNPTYDLWSTGKKPKNPETWITNW